jgi:hypothetical protein
MLLAMAAVVTVVTAAALSCHLWLSNCKHFLSKQRKRSIPIKQITMRR